MTRKGLRRFFDGRRRHSGDAEAGAASSSSTSTSPEAVSRLEAEVAAAEAVVVKWDPNSSAYAKITSLFYEDRVEAGRFVAHVSALQRRMLDVASAGDSSLLSHPSLARAQTLMQAAMRRLEKEFYQILAANRDLLDPESVSVRSARSSVSDLDPWDDDEAAATAVGDSATIDDLRAIANAMVFAGYGKECVRIYRTFRKSIVDDGLSRLGFELRLQSYKMDWPALEVKIRSWLAAARVAVRTLFHGERVLVDQVFADSDVVREAVFSTITGDAVQFFAFPELVARSIKRSHDKLFRLLDMHDALAELWPEVELVFSFESTASVRTQVAASLAKLTEAARVALADFESAIMKEPSRSPVPGGRVHPMIRYAMNYLALLADYHPSVTEIFDAWPPPSPHSVSATSPPDLVARLIETLLLKLDGKADAYRDAALSHLFMANNLQYVVNKVGSCALRGILGEDWSARHAAKARHHLARHERVAWGPIAAMVPATEVSSAAEAREQMRGFGAALEEALAAQAEWAVVDAAMREETRARVREMVVPAYRGFHSRWLSAAAGGAGFPSPDEVWDRLGGLFSRWSGSDGSGTGSSCLNESNQTV
ncbi:exocyst complex component EXO70H1-like [Curcuma longa]|uniref:exocyst complex component EXO70H1-like n=1 Tax=Curcuma longa TaxID=136217 RepID=UPI003D9E2DD8